ncbi:MAG: DinB family protein [Candidatus Kariarchaeaceae archaeon]
MKTLKHYKDLFRYNSWANQRYREIMKNISWENFQVDTVIGNLLERIVHIFASYEMWYKRMQGKSPHTLIKVNDFGSWGELSDKWENNDELLMNYLDTLDEADLQRQTSYISLDGKKYTRRIRHILLHLILHPAYHRGQISATFKQLGFPPLPPSDMVVYFNEFPDD